MPSNNSVKNRRIRVSGQTALCSCSCYLFTDFPTCMGIPSVLNNNMSGWLFSLLYILYRLLGCLKPKIELIQKLHFGAWWACSHLSHHQCSWFLVVMSATHNSLWSGIAMALWFGSADHNWMTLVSHLPVPSFHQFVPWPYPLPHFSPRGTAKGYIKTEDYWGLLCFLTVTAETLGHFLIPVISLHQFLALLRPHLNTAREGDCCPAKGQVCHLHYSNSHYEFCWEESCIYLYVKTWSKLH